VGCLGWAFGGFAFGIVADYIGRVRTLATQHPDLQLVHRPARPGADAAPLGICRFLAGVGTGAEIIVGIPLLAEAFSQAQPLPRSRAS